MERQGQCSRYGNIENGQPAQWLLVFWLLPFALFCGGLSIYLFDDPRTGRSGDFVTGSILIFASLPPGLWGIVELGILPGTKGPNLYGADPTQQLA